MIPFDRLGWIFHAFGALIYPRKIRAQLCRRLRTLPSCAKVLDVGAGTGVLCRFARVCRDDLVLDAVDPAIGMLHYCDDAITTHVARAEKLPFKDEHFDAVMTGEALHHFDDVHQALLEIYRVLKKGGLFFIYDFDPSKSMGRLIAKGEKLLGEPAHFYEPKKLKELLESLGFEAELYLSGYRYVIHATRK
ncbi:MAG: SAM-dependent methyltransferase [Sulfurovum sp.]|nr:MAG: SAM-dependent methyltransferase [Sulfurovum sp.]